MRASGRGKPDGVRKRTRIVNARQAVRAVSEGRLFVSDFGTATTFDVVRGSGIFGRRRQLRRHLVCAPKL